MNNTLEERAKEFVRVNEKMNSSSLKDWSEEMLLEAFKIFSQSQVHKALEEAAEKAIISFNGKSGEITVNKQSILSLKDKY